MTDHVRWRGWFGSGLAGLLSLAVGPGCTPQAGLPHRPGADARILASTQPRDSTAAGWWPSDSLRIEIVRPTLDESPSGHHHSIDPRTTLAIVDPDRAVWIMEARLDDRQGLELAQELEASLRARSARGPGSVPVRARIDSPAASKTGVVTVPGGRWIVVDADHPAGLVTLLLEDANATPLGVVELDQWMVNDVLLRLRGVLRGPAS